MEKEIIQNKNIAIGKLMRSINSHARSIMVRYEDWLLELEKYTMRDTDAIAFAMSDDANLMVLDLEKLRDETLSALLDEPTAPDEEIEPDEKEHDDEYIDMSGAGGHGDANDPSRDR